MKKYILVSALLFITSVAFTQISKNDLKGKLGISLYTGANIPATGNISSTVTTADLTNPGPHLGLGVSYYFTKEFGVEVTGSSNLSFYNDSYEHNGDRPVVSTNSFSVNGIYNFGHLFKRSRISPYVKAGIGGYYWKHLDDAPWRVGEVIVNNGIEQKGSSFGYNAGIGADYSVNKNFTIGLAVDYNMYFPKDEEKFGKEFGSQGYFTPQVRFSYYLPVN